MLFNSLDFLFFITPVLICWLITPTNYRWATLLVASFVFYGWVKPEYLLLLSATIGVTYYSAIKMEVYNKDLRKRQLLLYLSLAVNLGILFLYKYLGFFTEIASSVTTLIGGEAYQIKAIHLLLPIGISFYTFQSIGYSLDVYFKLRKPEKHLGYFALFVSFFPQILSGPIGRSHELFPQIHASPGFDLKNIGYGLQRFVWGLFKKIVIADRLDIIVNDIYGNISDYSGSVLWLGTCLFAFQLYCDFSAYTDMAIGVARLFGYKLAENFDFPFVSKNVTEFWRRWHLSLSGWLRDYVYTPIQFSKKKWGQWATVYAIFLTFFICGLWHGAKFTFVIFGILQGGALTYEMLTRTIRLKWSKTIHPYIYNSLSWIITFVFTLVSFVFFRAETTADAFLLLKKQCLSFYDIQGITDFIKASGGISFVFSMLLLLFFILTDYFFTTTIKKQSQSPVILNLIVSFLVVLIILLGTFGKVDFIYFQF